MIGQYVLGFGMAFAASFLFTPWVRRLAIKIGAIDKPTKRKVHTKPVPRLGGVAIAVAFLIPFLLLVDLDRRFIGLLAGFIILLGLGVADDVKRLRARHKLVWQLLAAVAVLAGGIGIVYFTNPFGGVIALDGWRIPVDLAGLHFNILPIANAVTVLWIVGMINTINFLDGLDGLAGGIASIAALVLFMSAVTVSGGSSVVALLAIILLGALLGFLPYNFHPASIFMGDSGAYTIGLLLALLSIYSGSKIAVGAIVLGFAIFDAGWTVLRRIMRKRSPFKPDRNHLHHQMLDSGLLSHGQVVLVLYVLTVIVAVALLVFGGVAGFSLLLLLLVSIVSVMRILRPLRN